MDILKGLNNKRVLITGATGGMGRSFAELFAKQGAKLGLHYLKNKKEALRLCSRQASIFQADLLKSKDRKSLIKSFVKRFGGIDVLINNAGAVYDYNHFSKLNEDAWQKTFDLNVKAPFYLSAEVFDQMRKQGGGKIINISSVNVKYGGSAKSMHYVASKAALESITRGFAKEGAKHNILVNAIRCGIIDTPMRARVAGYNKEDFKKRIELVPLKRAGKPEDIANMASFLAGDTGNFITGEIFTVAGGD